MHSFSLTATTATAALLAVAHAKIPQELLDRKLPDCTSTGFDAIEDKGTFWYNTGAEQFADDFINSHPNSDHTTWVQELYHDLFPDTTMSDYACTDPDAPCNFAKECDAYNAIGKGGLYYLFESLSNFHAYMGALKLKMLENAFTQASQVGIIREMLNLPDGKAEEPINFFALLSGAASIGSTAATNPAHAGGLAALSGVFSLLNEVMPKPEDARDMNDEATAAISALVGQAVKQSREEIVKVVAAVFGKFGHLQTDIPEVMRRGGVQNPAVSVLGWGDWLKDNGLNGLQDLIDDMAPKVDQSLLWQMARLYKRTYVVVRTDLDVNECTNPNNAWDAEKSRCLDLLSWDGSVDGTLGGANDLNDMWGKWNMDPFTTMRNAVDCWEANDGKIGPVVIDRNWADSSPPACYFAMTVLKGSYSDIQKGTLWLSGDFAGQSGMEDKLWPKNKCDSALERGDEECNYEWKEGGEEEEKKK